MGQVRVPIFLSRHCLPRLWYATQGDQLLGVIVVCIEIEAFDFLVVMVANPFLLGFVMGFRFVDALG